MELAAALHHSCGVKRTCREQKTASSAGGRRGVLKDPGPPWVEAVTVGYVAASLPLLSTAEVFGTRAVNFLLKLALRRGVCLSFLPAGEEEEEEEEETSSIFLSSRQSAPGCVRQGYWLSLCDIVTLVRQLRQATSPGLRGSSGGDSLLCVRGC